MCKKAGTQAAALVRKLQAFEALGKLPAWNLGWVPLCPNCQKSSARFCDAPVLPTDRTSNSA
jgi:hypothetical protein